MSFHRCFVCGLQLGETKVTWLNRLDCVRWLDSDVEVIKSVVRHASIYQAPSISYWDGQQVQDGSYVFGIHTACHRILVTILKSVGVNSISPILCELLHTIPFCKLFEADQAALSLEFDGQRIRYLPEAKGALENSTEDKDFIFADPVTISWDDLEKYKTENAKEYEQTVSTLQDRKADIFSKIPEEIICLIFENLSTSDIRILRSVSAAAAQTGLSSTFWFRRLQSDLPYATLLDGQSSLGPEAQYKLLKRILRNGTGKTANSLGNLRRIARHADQLCMLVQSRVLLGPGVDTSSADFTFETKAEQCTSIPLLAGPLYLSSLVIGRTHYISGIRVGSDAFGYHYESASQCLPMPSSSLPRELLLCNTEGGYVGFGFSDASGSETFVGQRSGPGVGLGKYHIEKGDIVRFKFDSFKLQSIKIGQPGSLRTPPMWTPQLPPPNCTLIPLHHSNTSLRDGESYQLCYFGGSKRSHLDTLVQINAFFVGCQFAITGLEFIYTKGLPQRWGSCYGTRQCNIIDGPGGERVIGIGATTTDIGVVQIRLRTNGHRDLVFKCYETDHPLPGIKGEGLLTGIYGLFRGLDDRFLGVKFSREIGILTEPEAIPLFVSKRPAQSDLGITLHIDMLSTVKKNSWGAFVSFAPLDQIETVEVAISEHERLTGMKLSYANCKSPIILADFTTRKEITQTACLSPFENITRMTFHYRVMQGPPFWRKTLQCLEIQTDQRIIKFGQCACIERGHTNDHNHCQSNQGRELGAKKPGGAHKRKFDEVFESPLSYAEISASLSLALKSKIVWIYNAEYDELFYNM